MAWRAYVVAGDDNPVPNDTIFITIEFRDAASTPPRAFPKSYKFTAGQDITAIQNLVRADRDNLRAFDNVRAQIKAMAASQAEVT